MANGMFHDRQKLSCIFEREFETIKTSRTLKFLPEAGPGSYESPWRPGLCISQA